MNNIDIRCVANGSMDGATLWVCDLRYKDYTQKPIRNVPPTKVVVVANGTTKVYYSQSHFRTLKKDGTASSKVIKPYDNTGFRSYTGEPLNVFETEGECVAKYREQLDIAIYHTYDEMRVIEEKAKELEKVKEGYNEIHKE